MSAVRARNVIIGQIAVIAVVLAIAEIVMRRNIDPLNDRVLRLSTPGAANCLVRDARRGLRYRPNCTGQSVEGTVFRTNELGLRDDPVRDDGAIRILAIGDSCTFGWAVEQDQSYPQKLARLLAERYGPNRYRVINAGIPGYTTQQGLSYLRDEGLALNPHIVIFGYGFNDETPTGDIEVALARNERLMPLLSIRDALVAHSALWRSLELWQTPAQAPEREVRVPPDKYKQNLHAIVDGVRQHGALPLMLLFGRNHLTTHRKMAWQVHNEDGVPLVVYGGPRLDLIHPTVEGYDELAAELLDKLETSGYLEAREPDQMRSSAQVSAH